MKSKIKIHPDLDIITEILFPEDITLNELRQELSEIDFSEPGIHVLLVPPGVGKTHTIKQYLKKQNSFLVATSSHKLIAEEYKRLGAKQWMGFEKRCKIYNKTKKFYEAGVPSRTICQIMNCDKGECKYHEQFKPNKASAPFQYLRFPHVRRKKGNKNGRKKGDFRFPILVVDESLLQYREIKIDKEEIIEAFDVIKKYSDEKYESINYLKNEVLKILDPDGDLIWLMPDDLIRAIGREKNNALKSAIADKNLDDITAICKLNLEKIKRYSYYKDIHGSLESYHEPYLYDVFDIAREGVPVVLLDATFDEKTFQILLERYRYEDRRYLRDLLLKRDLTPVKQLKINIYKGDLKNKDIKVYRQDKDNNYYKVSFLSNVDGKFGPVHDTGQKYIDRLCYFIDGLKKKYSKVGIITYKDLELHFRHLGPTEYFYNLKGSNIMKDVNALVIIGTPQNNKMDVIQAYNDLCMTNIRASDVYKLTYDQIDKSKVIDKEAQITYVGPTCNGFTDNKPWPLMLKGHNRFNDKLEMENQLKYGSVDADIWYPFEEFDYNLSESEKYQTIHRARLFRNGKTPDVFIFGDVPDRIIEEFDVRVKKREHTDELINQLHNGISPFHLYMVIIAYNGSNRPCTSKEIAKALKLYKDKSKSSYNTAFITKITKNEIGSTEIGDINDGIIDGLNSAEALKNRYKTLKKVDDKFIEDCIYYFHNGNFINTLA